MKNDIKHVTWGNNREEDNLEDGSIVLECLEDELLGDHNGDHIHGVEIATPSTSRFLNVRDFHLATQCPTLHGDHVATSHVPQKLPPTLAPLFIYHMKTI
jgi:hypothetical protein